MNPLKSVFFCALFFCLLIPSCTVKKRLHRKGYYVEWHNKPHGKGQNAPEKEVSASQRKSSDTILVHPAGELAVTEETKPELLANEPEVLPVYEEENPQFITQNDSPEERPEIVPTASRPKFKQVDDGDERTDEEENHPLAIVALILGILGIVLPLVGFLFALFAWILGKIAEDEIREHPERYKNLRMAKIGKILGIIGIAICCTILLIFFLSFVILMLAI